MTSTEDDELSDACKDLVVNATINVPVRNNHRTRDITRDFAHASKELRIGQLVKDDAFSLFDSVQALEIMDPKMDTGFLRPGETLDDEYDVCRNLLPQEVIWIMDELLSYEMAWHQGYPLAQNLLTSMYIYNLLVQDRLSNAAPYFRPLDGSSREAGPIVQKVLRTFCIGIIKSCDVVIEIMQTQQYYEEEDFNTHTFGLNLLTDVPDDEFFKLNQNAIRWLNNAETERSIDREVASALITRLLCREHFMNLILPNATSAQPNIEPDDFKALVAAIGSEHSTRYRQDVPQAFSGKLQRRLASTVPPRPIVSLSIETACSNLCKMYIDIREALKVEEFGAGTNIDTLSSFLWAFSAREPVAFARAVLQMFLFNEGKLAGPGDKIQALLINQIRNQMVDENCLQESFWQVETPNDPRFQVARSVDFFLEQAAPEYINLLRSLCQNRCRIRRCLTKVCKEVDSLAKESRRFMGDNGSSSGNEDFATLIQRSLYISLRLLISQAVEWAVALGFEQDVYQPDEFASMQYYVAEIWQQRTVLPLSLWTSAYENANEVERFTGTPMNPPRKREWHIGLVWSGLSMLYAALNRLDAIPRPRIQYCTAQARFELRMRPFSALTHGVQMTFPVFEYAAAQEAEALENLLDTARTRIQKARDHITKRVKARGPRPAEDLAYGVTESSAKWEADVDRVVLRSCVKASVAIDTLKRALDGADGGEEILRGRVTATMETPALGSYWLVPSVSVASHGSGPSQPSGK